MFLMFELSVFWIPTVQGEAEIWTSLEFEWSKRGLVANGPDFKWDLKSISPTIWNPEKWPSFCQKIFEIRTKMFRFWMVQFSNVGTIAKAWPIESRPFEIRPSKISDCKCFQISNGRISDPRWTTINYWRTLRETCFGQVLLVTWCFWWQVQQQQEPPLWKVLV